MTLPLASSVAPDIPDGFIIGQTDVGEIQYFFTEDGVKHHVPGCRPCGPQRTVCKSGKELPGELIPSVKVPKAQISSLQTGSVFECSMAPSYFAGYSLWHREPLNVMIDDREPVRLNVLMTGIGTDLTGGPLSIMRFMNSVLQNTEIEVRWINVDGEGITGVELFKHLEKYGDVSLFKKKADFVHGALRTGLPPLRVNSRDLFMSTLYFTTHIAAATARHPLLKNKNIIYFVQDFEPIFFPHDAMHLEALETYRIPHFAIYSTWFLQNYFQATGHGPYGHLDEMKRGLTVEDVTYASEPAIKQWAPIDVKLLSDRNRVRKVMVYARRHADRNAYQLTMDALSIAICTGIFDQDKWEFIGLGATNDATEWLGTVCNRREKIRVLKNIPEPEYAKLVQSGDVGLSLMVSPHTSLPPLDFAAAGLVTVTNSFKTKTRRDLLTVSRNFEVADPSLPGVVKALQRAVKRSYDVQARKANAKINWESSWYGDRCYGPKLMEKLQSWFETADPLWRNPFPMSSRFRKQSRGKLASKAAQTH